VLRVNEPQFGQGDRWSMDFPRRLVDGTIRTMQAFLPHCLHGDVEEPRIVAGRPEFDPECAGHRESVAGELLDELLPVTDLVVYQCRRIHGSTPSILWVMAS